MSARVAAKNALACVGALDSSEFRLRLHVILLGQALDLLDVEHGVLCTADVYREHRGVAAGTDRHNKNLLHIIRRHPSVLFDDANKALETLEG